jgi:hypothetical protein
MADRANALELEFHLATLLQDLRGLRILAEQSREAWLYTVQPLHAHASSLCMVIEDGCDDERQRAAVHDVFKALSNLAPPDQNSDRSHNESAWSQIHVAHGRLASVFAGRVKPWVVADPSVSSTL